MFKRRGQRGQADRAASLQDAREKVEELLRDPAFRALTTDGMHWINPFTGQAVPSPFDYQDEARKLLLAERPWEKGRPRSLHQVLSIKWLIFLRNHVRQESRLRLFHSDDRWLNPFTGTWIEDVKRVEGKIGATTLGEMARGLANSAEAQQGEMLPLPRLKQIYNETVQAESAATQMLRRSEIEMQKSRQRAEQRPSAKPDGSFGWAGLFDDDSPFDPTPTHQQVVVVLGEVQPLLQNNGLDWALHPGFDSAVYGAMATMHATVDEQVLILLARFGGERKRAAELVRGLREEVINICRQNRGFTEFVHGLADYAIDEGEEHPLHALVGLCSPTDHSMDWLACGQEPALAIIPEAEQPLTALGGKHPPLGTMHWEDYRKQMSPTLLELTPRTVVFAAHQELYQVMSAKGTPLGRQNVWGEVLANTDQHPRELLSTLMAHVSATCQRPMRALLPATGMAAIRVQAVRD